MSKVLTKSLSSPAVDFVTGPLSYLYNGVAIVHHTGHAGLNNNPRKILAGKYILSKSKLSIPRPVTNQDNEEWLKRSGSLGWIGFWPPTDGGRPSLPQISEMNRYGVIVCNMCEK